MLRPLDNGLLVSGGMAALFRNYLV